MVIIIIQQLLLGQFLFPIYLSVSSIAYTSKIIPTQNQNSFVIFVRHQPDKRPDDLLVDELLKTEYELKGATKYRSK